VGRERADAEPVRRPSSDRPRWRHQRLLERNHSPAGAERDAIVLANNESVNAFAIGRDLLAIVYGERYTPPRAAD